MDDDDDDQPTRTTTFRQAQALSLHQAALELKDRLERHASDLDEVRTRRLPNARLQPSQVTTAVGEPETARVTAARASLMAELFRQWVEEGTNPHEHPGQLLIWERVRDAARSLGVPVS